MANIKAQAWLPIKNSKLRYATVGVFGLVCANLLFYLLLVAPWADRLKADQSALAELRRRQAEAVQFQRQKPLFKGMQGGTPSQKDMPLFVKEFVQTAKKHNLSVASIKYDIPRQANGEPVMLAFSFPIEGRYPDIKRFIHEVETSGRLVGIKNMKMTAEKGRVKLDMKLVTYIKG